ncbi:hypothetical protein N0V90_010749 [Kalmusia sp. IMI 367209]|nr:hypothetical protein N0V90_010749 [Kalmusia sp. IMI 367209]
MDPYTHHDVHEELNAISSSLQTVMDRYSAMMLNMSNNEQINKITNETDVVPLSVLAAPNAEPLPVDQVVQEAFQVFDYRTRTNHPLFFSFIPSPASPLSVLGECLNSSFNTFAGCKFQGSGPSLIEKTLIAWLAERIGLPASAGGVFVSGGSMANLTAMAVARDRKLPHGEHERGVAYMSDQTHSSLAKALRILGFAKSQIRCLPSDYKFEMIPETLEKAIQEDREAGLIPFAVIATCDSFATDADYLRDVTEEEDVPNFWNYGMELTRPSRGMKLWFTMRVLGAETLGRMIDQGFYLAEQAELALRKREEWEIISPAKMAILNFRFAPPGKSESELDALNMAISKKLFLENVAGILTTKIELLERVNLDR